MCKNAGNIIRKIQKLRMEETIKFWLYNNFFNRIFFTKKKKKKKNNSFHFLVKKFFFIKKLVTSELQYKDFFLWSFLTVDCHQTPPKSGAVNEQQ